MTGADVVGLEGANSAFYDRFEARDLDGMTALWDHGPAVYCVHPGGEVISGWQRVRRSWAAVFTAAGHLQFIVTDVRAVHEGTVGWVTCTENILSGGERAQDLGAGVAVATNLFAYRGGAWRMTAHHASPVLRRAGSGPR